MENQLPENQDLAYVCLANAVPTKQLTLAKSKVPEGTNAAVSFKAVISARITRAEATEALPTASLLSEAMVAELVRRLGVTRVAFERHLREIAHETLVEGRKIGDQLIDGHPELLGIMRDVKRDVISQLPKQQRAGAIKVLAEVTLQAVRVR